MHRVPVVLVWPAWQRLPHGALAASAVAAIATHQLGRPHEVIGYASLSLALLRIGLGIAGPCEARFASFVRGAGATLACARAVRAAPRHLDHNPLGVWMVLALLGVVSLAAGSGALFVTDRFWGLAWLADLHAISSWSLALLVPLHVAGAIATGHAERENLVAAMVHGRKRRASSADVNRTE